MHKKRSLRPARWQLKEHHRFKLRLHLDRLQRLEELIAGLNERIAELCKPHREQIKWLDGIVGLDQVGAESVIAEVGVDMEVFPTDGHLCSWVAICSGNNESAGKRRSGQPRPGQLPGIRLPTPGGESQQEARLRRRRPFDSENRPSRA